MRIAGLENPGPLYEKHDFNGTPCRMGSNSRTCGGPIVEPWHHPDADLKSALEKEKS